MLAAPTATSLSPAWARVRFSAHATHGLRTGGGALAPGTASVCGAAARGAGMNRAAALGQRLRRAAGAEPRHRSRRGEPGAAVLPDPLPPRHARNYLSCKGSNLDLVTFQE